jgi:putative lipoprotein
MMIKTHSRPILFFGTIADSLRLEFTKRDFPKEIKMKKIYLFLIVLSITALPVLAACAGQSAGAGGFGALSGTSWKLASYGSASSPTAAAADIDTNLTFAADGTLGGNLGCNSMGGDYTVRNQNIVFGSVYSTEMACDEPRMAQESQALQVLQGTTAFKIEGNTLTITSSDGQNVLTFTKAAAQ